MQMFWDFVLDFRCVVVVGYNQNNFILYYVSYDI